MRSNSLGIVHELSARPLSVLFALGLCLRQNYTEGAALTGRAAHAHAPVMRIDQALGARKAETRAAVLARRAAVDLVERLEDLGLLIRCEADSGILDSELDGGFGRHHQRRAERILAVCVGAVQVQLGVR